MKLSRGKMIVYNSILSLFASSNWGVCEECEARVCKPCLANYHNENCGELEEQEVRTGKKKDRSDDPSLDAYIMRSRAY
jgi:hypothetical protein